MNAVGAGWLAVLVCGTAWAADEEKAPTSADHSGMDHSGMDHSGMDHSGMDHSGMDHSGMDHSGMDHSGMDHSGHGGHAGHKMTLDAEGMVMNWNEDTLPQDCKSISKDYSFEVRAGTKYAEPYNGTIFGMSQHEFRVEPCSRITVTFINEDEVRHQFMVHQLPKYLYPQGMFHLEAAGGATKKGTFIVPSDNRTYLVHCDLAQHMEKGMKGQLVVGRGGVSLPSIPGVTATFRRQWYTDPTTLLAAFAGGLGVALIGVLVFLRRH
jgi:plastocyanin